MPGMIKAAVQPLRTIVDSLLLAQISNQRQAHLLLSTQDCEKNRLP